MSAPASPRSSASASLTRQQLDELDTLLRRMLELPVQQLNEPPAPAETASTVSLSLLEPEPELAESSPAVTLRTDPPAPLATAPPPPPAEELQPRTDDGAPPPVWLWPLVWGNETFDRAVGRMGRPVRWLRRPSGRWLLGWAGVGCLAAALALLVYDWIRLTR